MVRPAAPERTCLGCRRKAGKTELLRIVRTTDGAVAMDGSGTAPGRGAYVHRSEACIGRAVSGRSMARALKTPLSGSEAARLVEELKASLGGDG